MSFNAWLYVDDNPIRYDDPSGKYDRDAAYAFASTHDLDKQFPDDGYWDFPGYQKDQCTMFVSSALSMGGYPSSNNWPGYTDTKLNPQDPEADKNSFYYNRKLKGENYKSAWIKTPDFYHFLKSSNEELPAVPTKSTLDNKNIVDFSSPAWNNWLHQNQPSIMRGDVVFYKTQGSSDWSHAALIVGWGSPTHYSETYAFELHTFYATYACAQRWETPEGLNNLSPIVEERSGSIKYAMARSIDNTANTVEAMSIIHIR